MSWAGTTLGESIHPRTEGIQGSHSVLGLKNPEETFCAGIERLQGSYSFLGWNDFRGVILSGDGTNPEESFSPGMERLQGSPAIMGLNDSRGVILF